MKVEIVSFLATDGVSLDGILRTRDLYSDRLLIQVHGMTSNCFGRRNAIIAQYVDMLEIDSLSFNNRGCEVASLTKNVNGSQKLCGTAFEDISESYFDIYGAIEYAVSRGYREIYLQGHSLGATKVIYAYNRMLKENKKLSEYVKALVLLSLVDVVNYVKHLAKDFVPYAEMALKTGQNTYLFYKEGYISPMSPQTFLRYAKHGRDINFAQFGKEHDSFEVLNSFPVPLFFRWGNEKEISLMDIKAQVEFLKRKIHNPKLDVGYIEGANHSYVGKEIELAEEITNFLSELWKKEPIGWFPIGSFWYKKVDP